MILLLAVLFGLVAGLLRALGEGRHYSVRELDWIWLVPVAFIPQFAAFLPPATRSLIPDPAARFVLICSQALLFLFAWINRGRSGFWALILGAALNFSVIVANGGLMPISPDTVQQLAPEAPAGSWQVGERLGATKDIVLPPEQTRLVWLTDRFLVPGGLRYPVAFSLGDVLLSVGAFWFLLVNGEPLRVHRGRRDEDLH